MEVCLSGRSPLRVPPPSKGTGAAWFTRYFTPLNYPLLSPTELGVVVCEFIPIIEILNMGKSHGIIEVYANCLSEGRDARGGHKSYKFGNIILPHFLEKGWLQCWVRSSDPNP